MSVTAVVLIKAKTDQINELARSLVEIKGISSVFSVAGRYDLVAIAHANENDDLADIVSVRMHKLPGIEESETLIAFRVYSSAEETAANDFGLD